MEIISNHNTHQYSSDQKTIQTKTKTFNEDSKSNEYLYKSNTTKNDNIISSKPVEFNCNCIGKYSYKNTEAITIINNNTNENNAINTNYTSDRKKNSKTEESNNNRISTNKTEKMLINKSKNKNINDSLSKKKTKEKTNPNTISEKHNENNILNESKKYQQNDKENPCLDLEVLNSWNLPIGLQLHIDEYGLKNSLRNESDGFTYFGFQTEESLNSNPYIDYLLGPKDQEYDEQFIGKHFQIRYDNNTKKYYIKDLGNGFGTFIKLINEEKIKDNLLINIGETYIVFSFDNENEKELVIKLFTGEEQCNTYTFNTDNQKCIIIGRDSSLCDVIIEDKMLSRIHCCVNYKEKDNEKGWYIKDGNMKGKKSTNDTWFYSAEETLIYDKMIFKTNHNLFKCIYK